MPIGVIKFFNESKGYGFVCEDDTNNEIFVHVTGLNDKVTNDDKVEFEIVEDKRGKKAVNVKKI
jgi:CspA family cold shock protein